jgi:hypothetical protein
MYIAIAGSTRFGGLESVHTMLYTMPGNITANIAAQSLDVTTMQP